MSLQYGDWIFCYLPQERQLLDFLFAFMNGKPILKGVYSKRKELAPKREQVLFY